MLVIDKDNIRNTLRRSPVQLGFKNRQRYFNSLKIA